MYNKNPLNESKLKTIAFSLESVGKNEKNFYSGETTNSNGWISKWTGPGNRSYLSFKKTFSIILAVLKQENFAYSK